MIERLTGELVATRDGSCVIEVSGVGFELGVSATTLFKLPPVGTEGVRLLCRMRARDEVPVLYGFATAEERSLFDLLMGVSGVGPKGALAILSAFSPEDLVRIVAEGDAKRLSAAKGVGKKTANRLVLELEGPLKTNDELKGLALMASASSDGEGASTAAVANAPAIAEAREALVAMGFTEREVDLALEGAPGDATLEALVGGALRRLGGGA